jgi:Ca2+-dependent lipid-binding protein
MKPSTCSPSPQGGLRTSNPLARGAHKLYAHRSKTQKDAGVNPTFNEKLSLDLSNTQAQTLTLHVMNANVITSDDNIGSVDIPLSKVSLAY